jgi:O-glycosyl hydrolase
MTGTLPVVPVRQARSALRRPRAALSAALFAVIAACTGAPEPSGQSSHPPAGPAVEVTIDGAAPRQTIVGFGGDAGPVVELPDPADKETAVAFAYGTMGVDHARMNLIYPEGSTASNIFGSNDDGDPASIRWSRFNFCVRAGQSCADDWTRVLPAMRRAGAANEYWGLIQGPRWNGFDGRSSFDPDELAEHQLATYLHFRDRVTDPFVVGWLAPFSEPGGGGINWPISERDAVTAIRAIGRRFEAAGFPGVKMTVPDATNVEQSIRYAEAILADPEARRFVGAIGYHTYDSGRSGADPDAGFVSLRKRIRDVAASHGLPVRMTERFDISGLLERANDVLNELAYAESQTYNAQHVFTTDAKDPAALVFVTVRNGRLSDVGPTAETGVAIGHFSRFAVPGSVRLGSTGEAGGGVRLQAFLDAPARKLSAVLVNNRAEAQTVLIRVAGDRFRILGPVSGDRSIEGEAAYWTPIEEVSPASASSFRITIPGRSVTSLTTRISDPSTAAPASAGTP